MEAADGLGPAAIRSAATSRGRELSVTLGALVVSRRSGGSTYASPLAAPVSRPGALPGEAVGSRFG